MDEDLWKDHPVQRQVAEPSPRPSQSLPVPAKPPEEAVSPEEAISPEEDTSKNEFDVGNGLGRGSDGRSKRERKDVNHKEPRVYKCSQGEKQIPPGVRRCTIKRERYRK